MDAADSSAGRLSEGTPPVVPPPVVPPPVVLALDVLVAPVVLELEVLAVVPAEVLVEFGEVVAVAVESEPLESSLQPRAKASKRGKPTHRGLNMRESIRRAAPIFKNKQNDASWRSRPTSNRSVAGGGRPAPRAPRPATPVEQRSLSTHWQQPNASGDCSARAGSCPARPIAGSARQNGGTLHRQK